MASAEAEKYYTELFGPLEGEAGAASAAGMVGAGKGGILKSLKKGAKRFGPEMIGWYLLDKFLAGRHDKKMQNIQMQGMREGAEASSPENLYYQASLPQAQQEEDMARSALLSQMSGGVIGPSLARGEKMIGG